MSYVFFKERLVNGDKEELDAAETNLNSQKESFYNKYKSTDLEKYDFSKTDEWKNYKKARKTLSKAQKRFDKAKEYFEHTDNLIDHYSKVDPQGFNEIDNLTYIDGNGNEKEMDVVVKTGDPQGQGRGYSALEIQTTNSSGQFIRILSITVTIKPSASVTSNVLGHEFGHVSQMAETPAKYYNEASSRQGEHNCQDPDNSDSFLTIRALEWQRRYDKLYKEYKQKQNDN